MVKNVIWIKRLNLFLMSIKVTRHNYHHDPGHQWRWLQNTLEKARSELMFFFGIYILFIRQQHKTVIIFGHAPPGVFERDWSSPGTHWLQHSHNIRWLDVFIHPCRLRWSHVSHQAKYNALVVCQPLEFQGLHSTIHFNWSDIWWYLTFNWFKVEHNNFIEPDSKLSLLTFSDIFVWLSSTLMSWWDSSLVTRTLIHSESSTITSVSFETSLHFYKHKIIHFNQKKFNNREKRKSPFDFQKKIKNKHFPHIFNNMNNEWGKSEIKFILSRLDIPLYCFS